MDTRTVTIKVYPTYIDPNYGQLFEYASHRAGILCARTSEQVKALVTGEQAYYANGKFFDYDINEPVLMTVEVEYHMDVCDTSLSQHERNCDCPNCNGDYPY